MPAFWCQGPTPAAATEQGKEPSTAEVAGHVGSCSRQAAEAKAVPATWPAWL